MSYPTSRLNCCVIFLSCWTRIHGNLYVWSVANGELSLIGFQSHFWFELKRPSGSVAGFEHGPFTVVKCIKARSDVSDLEIWVKLNSVPGDVADMHRCIQEFLHHRRLRLEFSSHFLAPWTKDHHKNFLIQNSIPVDISVNAYNWTQFVDQGGQVNSIQLQLDSSHEDDIGHVRSRLENLSQLKSVSILVQSSAHMPRVSEILPVILRLKNLEKLAILSCEIPHTIELDAHQLSTLAHCANLKHLALDVCIDDSITPSLIKLLKSLKLASLHLGRYSWSDWISRIKDSNFVDALAGVECVSVDLWYSMQLVQDQMAIIDTLSKVKSIRRVVFNAGLSMYNETVGTFPMLQKYAAQSGIKVQLA